MTNDIDSFETRKVRSRVPRPRSFGEEIEKNDVLG